ncbi:MAG TPA: thioredoxin domain-containing protein, partial [Pyrinomonadaceae bacterium]|nr:thioredoxin domain-containing protein [Pyrinomonadaceae bacterium]
LLDNAYRGLARSYDPRFGGFGGAPKFPSSMSLDFLLRTHRRTGDERALEMVTHSCRRMAEGGLYDQLGGGFHRYSTDARWLVPHFEKMLYDNALLARLYLHAYQATGDGFFRRVVEETLGYVRREMLDESGAFYSTQDADSEGVEGKFFVWDKEEVESLLGPEDARLFCAYFDVTEGGNFEERNILHVERPAAEVARSLGVSAERLTEAVERGSGILFTERERRVKPGRDEKVITAWNGLMLEACAEASAVLERDDYREVAERNAQFILDTLVSDGLLLHVYKGGRAKHVGFLEDYAFYASGLVALYETTGDARRLKEAVRLTEKMIDEFWDEQDGGFFYTGESGEKLIVRSKDYFDNATPSGNSVALGVLLRLSVLTGEEKYRRLATTVFRLMGDSVARYPSAFGYALSALDFYLSTPKEVVIVSPRGAAADRTLAREVWKRYLPNKVVVQAHEGDADALALVPLLRDRTAIGGTATAYVCENYTCQQPVSDAASLASQLDPDPAGDAAAV